MYWKRGGIRLFKSWTLVRLRGSGGKRVRGHLYTAVYRYIRPLPPLPPPAEERGGGFGGGGGVGRTPPSSYGPPRVPAEGGPKILKLKSSGRRSKIWLKHWNGRTGGGGGQGLLLWLSAVLIHPRPPLRAVRIEGRPV